MGNTYVLSTNEYYDGESLNGFAHGKGKFNDGYVKFEGEFKNGYPSKGIKKKGELVWNGEFIDKSWNLKKGRIDSWKTFEHMEGEFDENGKHLINGKVSSRDGYEYYEGLACPFYFKTNGELEINNFKSLYIGSKQQDCNYHLEGEMYYAGKLHKFHIAYRFETGEFNNRAQLTYGEVVETRTFNQKICRHKFIFRGFFEKNKLVRGTLSTPLYHYEGKFNGDTFIQGVMYDIKQKIIYNGEFFNETFKGTKTYPDNNSYTACKIEKGEFLFIVDEYYFIQN